MNRSGALDAGDSFNERLDPAHEHSPAGRSSIDADAKQEVIDDVSDLQDKVNMMDEFIKNLTSQKTTGKLTLKGNLLFAL